MTSGTDGQFLSPQLLLSISGKRPWVEVSLARMTFQAYDGSPGEQWMPLKYRGQVQR
ncbi:MAG: hypothetical protein PHC51_13455 [bacterium]|nr:hypothetical protein [bacterium]